MVKYHIVFHSVPARKTLYFSIPLRNWYTIRSVSASAFSSFSLILSISSLSVILILLSQPFPLRIAYHLAGLTFTGASFASSGHPVQNIRNRPASGPSCPGCAFLGSFLISGAWPGGFFSAYWGTPPFVSAPYHERHFQSIPSFFQHLSTADKVSSRPRIFFQPLSVVTIL